MKIQITKKIIIAGLLAGFFASTSNVPGSFEISSTAAQSAKSMQPKANLELQGCLVENTKEELSIRFDRMSFFVNTNDGETYRVILGDKLNYKGTLFNFMQDLLRTTTGKKVEIIRITGVFGQRNLTKTTAAALILRILNLSQHLKLNVRENGMKRPVFVFNFSTNVSDEDFKNMLASLVEDLKENGQKIAEKIHIVFDYVFDNTRDATEIKMNPAVVHRVNALKQLLRSLGIQSDIYHLINGLPFNKVYQIKSSYNVNHLIPSIIGPADRKSDKPVKVNKNKFPF